MCAGRRARHCTLARTSGRCIASRVAAAIFALVSADSPDNQSAVTAIRRQLQFDCSSEYPAVLLHCKEAVVANRVLPYAVLIG